MAITSIKRDWGVDPAIVRITSSDSLATCLGSTYLADQADNILALNKGAFDWKDGDVVLLDHSAGMALLSYDLANDALGVSMPTTLWAAQYTTAGGAAAEAITVTGALATDLAFVQLVDPGTATVTVSIAVMTADTLTVTFSGNPGNDAVINYQIIRV